MSRSLTKSQLAEFDLAAAAPPREAAFASIVEQWYAKLGGPWLESDPIESFKLLNEIENRGFEMAHELMPCGHSRGDYRDAGYIPGRPETYTAAERCVGCDLAVIAMEFGYKAHERGLNIQAARIELTNFWKRNKKEGHNDAQIRRRKT